MSKRRRMFDIDVPEAAMETFPAGKTSEATETEARRRGPMAMAVRESAAAVAERAAIEVAVREENDRLAHEHVRLKRLGLVTDLIPLDRIDTARLRRDRSAGPDDELPELMASIVDIGLSNPIRVEPGATEGRYELVQGWRRLEAYRRLLEETGEERWRYIPAGMLAAGDSIERSYRRMVDENLVRRDISFAEMAMLAQAYAADPEIPCANLHDAVTELYASAGYQKRSYIRAFAELLDMLDGLLSHPEVIPRNLGLDVRRQIGAGDPGLGDLLQALRAHPDRSADMELAILRGFVGQQETVPARKPGAPGATASGGQGVRKSRTSFRFAGSSGEIRCTAADGKLELRGATDFSSVERRKLEAAVAAFLAALED